MSVSKSTWKKYGGTNNLESANDITVNELTVDTLSLKTAYFGIFNVIGSINITGGIIISANIDTSGNVNVAGNADITGSITVDSNAHIKNKLYLGNTSATATESTNPFFYASQTFTGLNTTEPVAPLDISFNTECGLFFKSTNATNKNVLSKNSNNYGIIASTDDTASSISFYNESSILDPTDGIIDISGTDAGDGTISLTNGNLVLSSSSNLILNTATIFTTDTTTTAINNEFVTIYDSPTNAESYDYNRYASAAIAAGLTPYKCGVALSLVGYGEEYGDVSAGTFLTIVNTDNVGLGIIGGADPEDITNPFSSSGLFINKSIINADTTNTAFVSTNYFIPTQTTVIGNSSAHNRTSIGINNTNPEKDSFIMDINGQVRITNTDFFQDIDVSFQIVRAEHLTGNTNYIVAVGSPILISSSYKDIILISKDAGETWKYIMNTDSIINATKANKTFDAIHIHSENIMLLSNLTGQLIISFSFGAKNNWKTISGTGIETSNPIIGFNEIDVTDPEIPTYVLILYNAEDFQFVVATFTESTFDDITILNIETTRNLQDLSTIILDSTIVITPDTDTGEPGVTVSGIACKSASYCYITTSRGLYKVNHTFNEFTNTATLTTDVSHNTSESYNAVKIFTDPDTESSLAIFVGDSVISYTTDEGITFNDASISHINSYDSGQVFDTINIYSLTVATAVGKIGRQIYYTLDGAVTWSILSEDIMNFTGIYKGIVPYDENPLINAFMTTENTMVIFGVYSKYTNVSNGKSKIFKGYIPQIFSSSTNTVFDVCGNSALWGNVIVKEEFFLNKTGTVAGVLTCDSSAVINELVVNGVASFNGTIQSYTDISCATNTYTTGNSYITGSVIVATDVSVNGNIHISTDLFAYNDIHVYNNIYALTDISCTANIYTLGDSIVSGNVNALTNINVEKSIYSTGTIYCLTNLDVSENTICNSDIDVYGTLTTHGDASLSTLFVSGNTIIIGNVYIDGYMRMKHLVDLSTTPLTVGELISMSSITVSTYGTFGTSVYVVDDISLDGILYANGNVFCSSNHTIMGNSDIYGTTDISGLLTANGNITCTDTIKTVYLDALDSIITIGTDDTSIVNVFTESTDKTINLSYSANLESSNYINIGNLSDIIYIRGKEIVFVPEIRLTGPKLQLLHGNTNLNNSGYAGLYIRDNLDDSAAYVCVNFNMNGFLLKSPTSTNILNINLENITLTDATDYITGETISAGLLVFTNSDDGTGNVIPTVGTLPIDANNIFIKNNSYSTTTTQYISTNTSISGILKIYPQVENGEINSTTYTDGAVVINGGLGISGAINTNSNLSVAGVIKCTAGTDSSSYTTGSVIVTGGIGISGKVYTNNKVIVGNVLYAAGNIKSLASDSGSLVVTGGAGISGNLFVDGKSTIAGITYITTDISSTTIFNGALVVSGGVGISGKLNVSTVAVSSGIISNSVSTGDVVVSGGVGVGGNVYIGNTTNILGNVTSTSNTTGTLIVTGGAGISGNVFSGGNITAATGYISSKYLFIENTIEKITTRFIDATNIITLIYSDGASIIYLNMDTSTINYGILTLDLLDLPTSYTNKLITINIIIPTQTYIGTIKVNGVVKSIKFNGGIDNIFIDANEVTLQTFTFIFTSESTPTHVISSITSYYD